jgi:hypothetical protein
VEGFVVNCMKTRINVIEWWSRMLSSPQDGTALDIVKDGIELV